MTSPRQGRPGDPEPRSESANTHALDRRSAQEAAAFVHAGGAGGLVAESGGLYGVLVESVQDYAIFALDASGHVLSWNIGAQRIKGYRPEEIIGRHFSVFYPPEDVAAGKTEWELEVAKREGRVEDEGWRVRKDGTRFWANVVITALHDERGTLIGFAKVTRDLTDHRRAEEAIRESEERFRLIVQQARDYAIFMLDPDGRVATWNEGAERIKGYTAEEIIGRHFSVFLPPEDVARGKPRRELETAKELGRFEDEGWRVRKDGTRFWANVVITALRDRNGSLVGFSKVTRDLTERKAAEDRAIADASRVAAAEAANEAKSEFLATMSHELRTPLNAIGGYAELLELGVAGSISPQQRDFLERIRASQRHLLGIINDLLNISRIEAGQVEYQLEPVTMRSLAERGFEMVTPQAVAKGIELVHAPCLAEPTGWGDRAKLEQVVLNLLSNAVKFTPEGGRISIACDTNDETATLSVSDTGPGIPVEKQETIFEPFVQLGRGLKHTVEGAGLGLAISRDLARGMGGELRVMSAPGAGSTFVLSLPLPPPAGA